jgi:hypothetical protein
MYRDPVDQADRNDIAAAAEAHHELGRDYDGAAAESSVDRIDRIATEIERRAGLVPDGQGDVPLCGSDDLAMVVSWEHDGPALNGQVIAENISDRACRLAGKPGVTLLQPDGAPLPVKTTITLEMNVPWYVILQPGQRAAAPVHWSSWCGQQASDRARVDWPGGSAVATVHGPVQPECSQDQPSNLTSSWFHLMT